MMNAWMNDWLNELIIYSVSYVSQNKDHYPQCIAVRIMDYAEAHGLSRYDRSCLAPLFCFGFELWPLVTISSCFEDIIPSKQVLI